MVECEEKFFTAVEVTAGNRSDELNIVLFNESLIFLKILWHYLAFIFMTLLVFFSPICSLFHVVVETDDISTKIIRYLTAEKGGRVTFIPLNRVKGPEMNYPQSPDVVPLLKKLKYRSDYAPAFMQVCFTSLLFLQLEAMIG